MLYLGKIGCIRQSSCVREKLVIFGQKWLYSGNWLYLDKTGCIRANWLSLGCYAVLKGSVIHSDSTVLLWSVIRYSRALLYTVTLQYCSGVLYCTQGLCCTQ